MESPCTRFASLVFLFFLLFVSSPACSTDSRLDSVHLPPGFRILQYAANVPGARSMALGPHVAALGMRFYTGQMFPPRYRNQIFIAEHGSWNRSTPIGYRITLVTRGEGSKRGYEVFAEGWLSKKRAWGRPVDVLVMPDGALLVSDDKAEAIYRITYGD